MVFPALFNEFLSVSKGPFSLTYLLFFPEDNFDTVHRHYNADLLLLDVLGLEFVLRKKNTFIFI